MPESAAIIKLFTFLPRARFLSRTPGPRPGWGSVPVCVVLRRVVRRRVYGYTVSGERRPQDMLGDLIGEETGKVTGFRVLDAAGPKVEVSFQTRGKVLGNDYQGR